MNIKRFQRYLLLLVVLSIAGVVLLDCWISRQTAQGIYSDLAQLPPRSGGVVLGTAKYIRRDDLNPFYLQRIQGALKAYQQGRIATLLLSGDNRTIHYNEPLQMQRDLIRQGVPAQHLVLDHAGLRTLDSVLRAHQVFGLQNFTLITQRFHCERALFIAHHFGIHAQCYAVADPPPLIMIKTRLREILARSKMVIDLYILQSDRAGQNTKEDPTITSFSKLIPCNAHYPCLRRDCSYSSKSPAKLTRVPV